MLGADIGAKAFQDIPGPKTKGNVILQHDDILGEIHDGIPFKKLIGIAARMDT
jgi:hypothetical protein